MEGISPSTGLIAALSQVAVRVQRMRDVAGVLQVAGDGLTELGFDAALLRQKGNTWCFDYLGLKPEVAKGLRDILGQEWMADETTLAAVPLSPSSLQQGEVVFLEAFAQAAAHALVPKADAKAQAVVALLERGGYRHGLAAPLWVNQRPWGGLVLSSSCLSRRDVSTVQLFAAQLSAALEMAYAIDSLERKNRALGAVHEVVTAADHSNLERYLPRLLGILGQATESEHAAIYLLDAQRSELVLSATIGRAAPLEKKYARIPLNGTVSGTVAQTLKSRALAVSELSLPTRIDLHAMGLSELAIVPMQIQGRLAGTLNLARTTAKPFTDDDMETAALLGEQIAIQVENARLFKAEHRRAQDLAVINELGAQIADRLDLSSVLASGVHYLAELCNVPNVLLFLLDRPSMQLRLVKSNRPDERLPEILNFNDPSSATSAIRAMAPVVIEDAVNDPRTNKAFTERLKHTSVLALPLIAAGQPIGSVILGETREKRPFVPAEVERAMAICNQLAAAISAARLYDDLKRSYHELSRTQEELVKRERLAAVGELAALVAHEVRNPLTVIFNSLSSLKKRVAPDEHVQVLFRILTEEANRLNGIVGDFLDFARPHEPELQVGSLSEIIEGAIEAARGSVDAGAVGLQLQFAQTLAPLSFDPRLLRQAFINLIVNALQAMPKGGTLSVRTSKLDKNGKAWAQVEIADTGGGISLKAQKKLFQPFFTTKATGTGLGLAVVKRIIDAHHGEIEFESVPERGTEFRLRLPFDSKG